MEITAIWPIATHGSQIYLIILVPSAGHIPHQFHESRYRIGGVGTYPFDWQRYANLMIGTYLEKTNTERGVCNFIEFAVKHKV